MSTRWAIAWASILGAVVAGGACGLDWTIPGDGGDDGDDPAASSAATGGDGGNPGGAPSAGGDGGQGAQGGSSGAASTTSAGGATSAAVSSSSSGMPTCDMAASCNDCDDCAINRGCAAAFQACEDEFLCTQLDACIYTYCANLGDVDCLSNCYTGYPTVTDLYDALAGCIVCAECPTACSSFQQVWGC